jgi:hypothetical protein
MSEIYPAEVSMSKKPIFQIASQQNNAILHHYLIDIAPGTEDCPKHWRVLPHLHGYLRPNDPTAVTRSAGPVRLLDT